MPFCSRIKLYKLIKEMHRTRLYPLYFQIAMWWGLRHRYLGTYYVCITNHLFSNLPNLLYNGVLPIKLLWSIIIIDVFLLRGYFNYHHHKYLWDDVACSGTLAISWAKWAKIGQLENIASLFYTPLSYIITATDSFYSFYLSGSCSFYFVHLWHNR